MTNVLNAWAQAAQPDPARSPEIHPDRTVTFRIRAPRATNVSLVGDWMPTGGDQKLAQSNGTWSVTVGPLAPGLAIYNFNVDGLAIADPVNPRIKLRARTSASLVDVPGDGSELWQPRDVPHGLVQINWHRSNVAGDARAFYVYTPPGYERESRKRYPVLLLLHGNNDTEKGWSEVGKANFILDNLIAQGKANPMIVVMPWGHVLPYGSPNDQNSAAMERYLLEEILPLVERNYRTRAGRNHRAIAGLSMGGGHSLQIGLTHLETFSAVGAFSAAVPQNFENRFKAILEKAPATNRKLKLFWIGCGKDDFLIERNRTLDKTLSAKGVKHTYLESEGRHNYAVWRQYLGELAPLLFR